MRVVFTPFIIFNVIVLVAQIAPIIHLALITNLNQATIVYVIALFIVMTLTIIPLHWSHEVIALGNNLKNWRALIAIAILLAPYILLIIAFSRVFTIITFAL